MRITVKELIEQLQKHHMEDEVYFGGLEFYQVKDRDAFVQIEFCQTVYVNDQENVVVENHREGLRPTREPHP